MKNRTLDWRNRRSWLTSVRHYAKDLLTQDIRETLSANRSACWSDDMSWLPNHESLVPAFRERMTAYYTHVKAFHGCRPDSLNSYYAQGLLGQNHERIKEQFIKVFQDVDSDRIERAIQEMESRGSSEKGKIWLTADDAEMIEEFGHYAINGSEYLLSLAACLKQGGTYPEDYRMRLRKTGIPTILEVDVPIMMVPRPQQLEVAQLILSEWGQVVAKNPLNMDMSPCYVIREDIPPACIKAHYHPRRIPDPHHPSRTYLNEATVCELCVAG